MSIKAGVYDVCGDAEIVVFTAGAAQKPGQTRLELVGINARIAKDVATQVKNSGFKGILVVASISVDILTYVAYKASCLPKEHVIGSGTILDTARLRYNISKRLGMAPSNVHAYILGEHGDSSFVPWIHCYLGCKNLLEYIDEEANLTLEDLQNIYMEVRNAAYEIIDRKKATYYGIGLALKRLVSCLLNDEKAILTVSTYQNGEYGREGYYIGVPAVVGNNGVEKIIRLSLNEMDQNKFNNSFDTLQQTIEENLQEVLADLD